MRYVFAGVGLLVMVSGLRRLVASPPEQPQSGRAVLDEIPVETAERLGGLATELLVPGGRSQEEVLREAATVYEQLPPEVRSELEKHRPTGTGVHVDVDGPLGHAVARMAGFPAPPPAPGEIGRPSSWTVTAEGPVADVPATELTPVPAPAPAPAVEPEPAVVPVAQPDTRFGVLAPDVLTGDEDTPPGAIAEGWYRTADGTRERWHNGAAWTAHERPPGGY